MTLEQQIFDALGGIFAGRVYALTFPQSPSIPVSPACRFTFATTRVSPDICGDGADLADIGTQVDLVAKDFNTARALRLQVIAAMAGLSTTTLLDGGFDDFDDETKLYRCTLEFVSYPSST